MIRLLYKQIQQRIDSPEAIIVTGMRRVGKTILLKQIYESLSTKNKLFLDLENPFNQKYFEEEDYEKIKYDLENLGLDTSSRPFVFLDEIQLVKNIPSFVKYVMDHYNWKFFLTGSSSFYLKNLFSESLAGRKIIYELFPLSFEEFLELKNSRVKIPRMVTNLGYGSLITLYREYIEYGGFPGVVIKNSISEKKEALDDIFSSYFQKEVLALGGFRSNNVIRDLISLLAARTGSRIEIQKLASELGVNRASIYEYLAFLEGTYFIFLVSPYSRNKDTEIRGAKKVYFCDSGMVRHLGQMELGKVFENSVYNQLKVKGGVNYFQKKSGIEIDFILDKKQAFEVKVKPSNKDLKNLQRLTGELGLLSGHLVSFEHSSLPVIYGFKL